LRRASVFCRTKTSARATNGKRRSMRDVAAGTRRRALPSTQQCTRMIARIIVARSLTLFRTCLRVCRREVADRRSLVPRVMRGAISVKSSQVKSSQAKSSTSVEATLPPAFSPPIPPLHIKVPVPVTQRRTFLGP
jgi:hypothetical protein